MAGACLSSQSPRLDAGLSGWQLGAEAPMQPGCVSCASGWPLELITPRSMCCRVCHPRWLALRRGSPSLPSSFSSGGGGREGSSPGLLPGPSPDWSEEGGHRPRALPPRPQQQPRSEHRHRRAGLRVARTAGWDTLDGSLGSGGLVLMEVRSLFALMRARCSVSRSTVWRLPTALPLFLNHDLQY
ncbi:unnamed protein product [Caretta caretta]